MRRQKKPPKPKAINFELIPPMDGSHEPEPYRILREIRDKHHPDLWQANIALAWRKNFKRDVDGHLVLGRCVKASDLNRECAPYDFVILLNREVWQDSEFLPEKKRALVDHELCHAARAHGKDGEPKEDERGRPIWRMRKHDIEEFREIVIRHGCYKRDLEEFGRALLAKQHQNPLLPLEPLPDVFAEQVESLATDFNPERLAGSDAPESIAAAGPDPLASEIAEASQKPAKRKKKRSRRKLLPDLAGNGKGSQPHA
jgi:hypothetical protein